MSNDKIISNIITKDGVTLIPIETTAKFDALAEQIATPEFQTYLANQTKKEIFENLFDGDVRDVPFRNPNERTEELLEESRRELQSIRYEDKKTNTQLQILLDYVDSQNEKLENLESTNRELRRVNAILEKEHKRATRKTVIWSIVTGVILLLVEHCIDIYKFIISLIR